MKHRIIAGVFALLTLMGAMLLLTPAASAHVRTHSDDVPMITYHRALHAGSLVDGRMVQIAVQNFESDNAGTLTLNTTQPAILGAPGTDVQETIAMTATLDGKIIGTNTVGPFMNTTPSTPLVLSVTAPVTVGWHRFALVYEATPVGTDQTVCTPYPQGCSPIVLSHGRLTLNAPSRL